MRTIFSMVAIILLSIVMNAQSLNFQWVKQFGGISGNSSGKTFVQSDASGNIYSAGKFFGSIDFNPSTASGDTFIMTAAPYGDLFFSKIDSSGNFVWAKNISSDSLLDLKTFVLDDSANIYYVGTFNGTIDFNPGQGIFNLSPFIIDDFDGYVSKLDSAGDFIWVSGISEGYQTTGVGLVFDKFGHFYISGHWVDHVGFGGDYLENYYASGVPNWANPIAGCGKMAIDNSRKIYTYIDENHAGPQKFDSLGNLSWSSYLGVYMSSIGLDDSANFYMTGHSVSIQDFDPDTSSYILTAVGSGDIYISKIDSSRKFKWAEQIGSAIGSLSSNSMAVDPSGNIYITGSFSGTVDFDPGAGVYNLASSNGSIFIWKLNSSGNFVWAKQFGSASGSNATDIKVNPSGEIIVTGTFSGTADFDPGPNIANRTSIGNEDVFVLRLNQLSCSVDTSVSQVGDTLIANATGASYQWIDCSDHSPVVGQTNQNFVPVNIGNYAVVVTQNTCSETSSCYSILNVGMNEDNSLGRVHVFPNPVHGTLSMTFDGMIQNGCIKIIDITGQTVFEKSNLSGTGFTFDLSGNSNGFYMIELKDGENISRMKLVKD